MIGVFPRRTPARFSVACAAVVVLLALTPGLLSAQSTGSDLPSLPATPDATPAVTTGANPVIPPYSPSNNAASPLLPSSPPLPPHPSIPTGMLLPDSTPPPASTPPPLPVPAQTGSPLGGTDNPVTNASGPGTNPSTPTVGGAAGTTNTGAVRRFQYAFRLTSGVSYDDNLFLTTSQATLSAASRRGVSRDDVLFSVAPSVSLGYGDFLSRQTNYVEFDYTANVLLYAKNTDQDTVEHSINLQGAYHFAQITLTLSQGVQLLNSTDLSTGSSGSALGAPSTTAGVTAGQVNLDASRRTGLDIYSTHVSANYALSDKTSFDLGADFSASEYETLVSSETISGNAYFNYSPTGKITLGLGVTGGYTVQDQSAPDEFYQQLNLRLTYAATSKLNVSGSVGIEARETSGVGKATVNPIFDLTITYAPFDSTALSLAANRRIDTSAVLVGEDFDSTGFTFTISQSFFQRAHASLSLGYTHSSYVQNGLGATTNRDDDYYFVQPTLDYSIRDNISASVFYVHRQNASTLSGNGFRDNQIGARLSFSF